MRKHKSWVLILVLFLILFAAPTSAMAKGLWDDQVIAGGNFTLADGEILDGNLLVFGGNANIEDGAIIRGDVLIFGGNLLIAGSVQGSVVSVGGSASIADSAIVTGDLVNVGGSVNRAPGAQISGQVINSDQLPLRIAIPSLSDLPREFDLDEMRVDLGFDPIVNNVMGAFWFLFRVFITSALAVLVILMFPHPSQRSSEAIARQPVLSFVVGFLTLLVLPVILVVLALTILLIPVSLVGVLLFAILVFFGWVVMGYFIGMRFMGMLRQNWAPAVAAGVGTFLLSFVAWGFSAIVPCVGWLLPWTIATFGLGAVLITRIGTQSTPGNEVIPGTNAGDSQVQNI
jgi:hypothetical protein